MKIVLGENDVKFKRYNQGSQGLEWCGCEYPTGLRPLLSEKYGAKIYLKKENAQRVRSFKIRGAYYAIPSSARKNVSVG